MQIEEIMTFDKLVSVSSDKRKERANNVRYKTPPNLQTEETDTEYTFKTKSHPSESGKTYESAVLFYKPKNPNLPLGKCKVKVDCSCPDYRYTWAYANKKKGSSDTGLGTLNKSTNSPPVVNNPRQRTGMCKHLVALNDYVTGEYYNLPEDMSTDSKLKDISSKNRKPVKSLPGAEKRKLEIDKLKPTLKEELDSIKSELLWENVEIKLIDLL